MSKKPNNGGSQNASRKNRKPYRENLSQYGLSRMREPLIGPGFEGIDPVGPYGGFMMTTSEILDFSEGVDS